MPEVIERADAVETGAGRRADWGKVSSLLGYGQEGVLLALACAAPWALGGAAPWAEAALDAGVALLLLLAAARLLARGRLEWPRCPVALCQAGLFLLAALQLAPLPAALRQLLCPGGEELRGRLLPARPEAGAGAGAGGCLSLYPHGTRRQAAQLLAALAVFALARSLASPAALWRLAAAALANGAL